MKKLFILSLFVCAVATVTNAQLSQGVIIAGGGISFSSQKESYEVGSNSSDIGTYGTFSITPRFGYFVIDNFAVGAEINFSSDSFKPDGGGDKQTQSSILFGPFARYYFGNIFLHGQVGFGTSKYDYGDSGDGKSSEFGFGVGAGYALFLTDAVAIEPMFMYNSSTSTDKDSDPEIKDKYSGFTFGVNFQIYLNRTE